MSDRSDWMDHLTYLPDVALSDLEVLAAKESTYQGSWKRAGGRSAWFMFRRNMDRLISMMAPPKFPEAESFSPLDMEDIVRQSEQEGREEITLSAPVAAYLYKCWESEDLFRKIQVDSSGADGTVLACLRDLRRYAMLVEAEMLSQGLVEAEAAGDGGEAAQTLARTEGNGWSILGIDFNTAEAAAVYGAGEGGTRTLAETALTEILRLVNPSWSEEILARSVEHTLDKNPGADVYTQIAFLTGEDRNHVKQWAYSAMYGPEKRHPRADRISRAVAHAVNYHGLDARLNTPDHVIADLITREVLRHLEGQTDVQLVEQGNAVLEGLDKIKPGTPEDGGHHARFAEGGIVPGVVEGSMLFGDRSSNVAEIMSDEQITSLSAADPKVQAASATIRMSAGTTPEQVYEQSRRMIGDMIGGLARGRRPVATSDKTVWSMDFVRLRRELLPLLNSEVDLVRLRLCLHTTAEVIQTVFMLRGGELSFETAGAGIRASGEATEVLLGRLFGAWCVSDLPAPSGQTSTTSEEKSK